jgi:hypothetical protein
MSYLICGGLQDKRKQFQPSWDFLGFLELSSFLKGDIKVLID